MSKSKSPIPEARFDERVHLVVSREWLEAVDEWRKQQAGLLFSRSEAIRELVERQLGSGPPPGGER